MNYSLNALWWRLNTPQVRDLASLLTAPPLWLTGKEATVPLLLGDTGFRLLLALDDDPSDLLDYLKRHQPFHHRLGFYAETLLAFWFQYAPHAKLIAQNIPVQQNKQTLGAFDFIVELNERKYHLELTCKYYGSGKEHIDLYGLNSQDTLSRKVEKLQNQLALSQLEAGQEALKALNIDAKEVISQSIVRGMAFFSKHHLPQSISSILNPLCWQGEVFLPKEDYHSTDFNSPEFTSQFENLENNIIPHHARISILSPMQLLSPQRLPQEKTLPIEVLSTVSHQLIAVLEQRIDGFWHEINRIMWR